MTTTASMEPISARRAAGNGVPIQQRVRRFIQDSFFVDEVGDAESFLESGIIDSLGIVQIVAFVESELGLAVPDTDLVPSNFDSIDRIAAYVERRRQAV
jgi:acyl carrier protein